MKGLSSKMDEDENIDRMKTEPRKETLQIVDLEINCQGKAEKLVARSTSCCSHPAGIPEGQRGRRAERRPHPQTDTQAHTDRCTPHTHTPHRHIHTTHTQTHTPDTHYTYTHHTPHVHTTDPQMHTHTRHTHHTHRCTHHTDAHRCTHPPPIHTHTNHIDTPPHTHHTYTQMNTHTHHIDTTHLYINTHRYRHTDIHTQENFPQTEEKLSFQVKSGKQNIDLTHDS